MYRATNRRSRAGSVTAASLPPPRLQIPDEPPKVPRRPPSKGNKRETLGDIAKRIPVQLMRQYFNYPLRAAAEVRNVCMHACVCCAGSETRVVTQHMQFRSAVGVLCGGEFLGKGFLSELICWSVTHTRGTKDVGSSSSLGGPSWRARTGYTPQSF